MGFDIENRSEGLKALKNYQKQWNEDRSMFRIGLGTKRAIHLALAGPQAIDVWRLCQIADALDVSLDWPG